jgi:hypothetical protein
VPTYDAYSRFRQDFKKLAPHQRERVLRTVRDELVPDLAAGKFRPGLRVKKVQAADATFETTWAPDGRATWEYGSELRPGDPHVVWRRAGGHEIFDPGPP